MAISDNESIKTGAKIGEGTVVLLGAGASKHLGLPLADELLPEMFAYARENDWAYWGGDEAQKELFEFLSVILPSFQDYQQKIPGLEYFLSLMDVYQQFFAEGVMQKKDKTVEKHRKRLLQLLVDYMWKKMEQSRSSMEKSAYLDLVRYLSEKDTIISLNWDLACEWAFCMVDRRADWSYSCESSKLAILKLHGSMNWREQIEGITPASPQDFTSLGSDVSFWKGSLTPGASEDHNLSAILDEIPVIIPPSHIKDIKSEVLRRVWREAYHRLLHCKKIIIAGSSLREDDLHLYSLLSLVLFKWNDAIDPATKKEVKIVGPGEIAEKFRQKIFPNCEILSSRFEDVDWDQELTSVESNKVG